MRDQLPQEFRAGREPGDAARTQQPLVARADDGVGEGEPGRQPAQRLGGVQHHRRARDARGAQRVEVDHPPVRRLGHAHGDEVELRGALAERLERALDDRHAASRLGRERERHARELALRDQHPRSRGQGRSDQPDQRRHRGPDRDPLDRHPDEVGVGGARGSDGRVEVRRPGGAATPVVDRGGDRVAGAGRWDADARGVEVAVGDVELLTERGAHGAPR